MKHKIKRWIALLACLALLVGVIPVPALAAETTSATPVETVTETYINPLYADVITEADLNQPGVVLADVEEYHTTTQAAGEAIREQLKTRTETIVVGLQSDNTDTQQMHDVMNTAMEHTGIPTEGDYLKWQYGGWQCSMGGYSSGGIYYLTLTYTMTYYTTAEQETQMDSAVDSLLSELDLSGKSDYEKVRGVYDYICDNVTYDYDNLEDDAYKLKYTAYAALINRTSVCQGYAVLLYRLALELGVDCRFIAGIGNGGAHGWNIIELDSLYYNADSTWDAGRSSYSYFLVTDENFGDHTRNDEYATEEFYAAYPMATNDYDPDASTGIIASGTCGDNLTWVLDDTGEMTITGTGNMWDFRNDSSDYDYHPCPWEGRKEEITSVVFENGITYVGVDSFSQCPNLETVTFSDSITFIGSYAFFTCRSLQSFSLPNRLEGIGQQAFSRTDITSVVIPGTVSFLDSCVFEYCPKLTSVYFEKSESESYLMGNGPFRGCSALEEIRVDPDHIHLRSVEGVLYLGTALVQYPANKKEVFYEIASGTTILAADSFMENPHLQQLTIPDSVTEIGSYSFFRCSSLTSITIPEGISSIETGTFSFCSSLASVTIPNSVTSFGTGAFNGCSSLVSITIPESVTDIGNYAFGECSTLASVMIPDSVVNIGDGAFSNCSSLSEVTFTGNAPTFSENTFEDTTATAYYPANNETWAEEVMQNYGGTITWVVYTPVGAVDSGTCGENLTWVLTDDGKLTISGEGTMKNYTNKSEMPWHPYLDQIESVVIEKGVTTIGDYAFYGMPNLTSITIPDGVTTIGAYAFKNCTALDNVVLPSTLTKIGDSAFFGCTSLSQIEIPEGIYTIWAYTFKNCTSLAKVKLPSTLIKIDEAAFYGCSSLTELTVPDSVSIIGIYCFKNCTSLESVHLPAKLTEVREAAFYGTALTSLEIPEGVTKIGPYAFKNCTSLAVISLPESLISIGEAAFYGSAVQELVIPDAVTSIGSYAFKNCTALESVQLPASLTAVSEASFYNCGSLTTLVIPDSVTSIGNYAFRNCTGLTSVSFGSRLTTIGESSFYGSSKLTSLEIPEGVTTIGAYAFKSCTGLTSVSLPGTLTTIGDSAFYGCTGLTEIVIPKNVTTVGAYAFSRCTGLKKITFNGNAPSIGENAFSKVVATVYYSAGNTTWTSDVKQNYGGTLTWEETA